MILRENLEEKPWNEPAQLSEEQTEELIQDLIEGLNNHPNADATWTCAGNTLVATTRQRLNDEDYPIFFICTIRKRLVAKDQIASTPSLMGTLRWSGLSAAGGIFIKTE